MGVCLFKKPGINKMAKVLLVDTNRAAYTIYQSLLSQGHDVSVVGGNAKEPLAKICPNFIQLDYSDARELDGLIDKEEFDFLVPGCTDVSYKVCAEVNRGRFPGIDSVDATRRINEKSEFRALAGELGIPVPRVLGFEEALGEGGVIIKPVDSFSGRGITILKNPSRETLVKAQGEACGVSKSGEAMVEEFVSGQLYSHSAFLEGGEVVADFTVREDCTTNPFTVDTSCLEFDFDEDILDQLRIDACKLFKHLKLQNGLIHSQFILGQGQYWIIEVTRRCPGDLYALLIEMSTGYPYGASYAASFLGEAPLLRSAGYLRERIIRHTATSRHGESLWGFQFKTPIDLKFFVPLATAGEQIDPSPYGRAALFFLAATSKTQQDLLYRQLLDGDLHSMNLPSPQL